MSLRYNSAKTRRAVSQCAIEQAAKEAAEREEREKAERMAALAAQVQNYYLCEVFSRLNIRVDLIQPVSYFLRNMARTR